MPKRADQLAHDKAAREKAQPDGDAHDGHALGAFLLVGDIRRRAGLRALERAAIDRHVARLRDAPHDADPAAMAEANALFLRTLRDLRRVVAAVGEVAAVEADVAAGQPAVDQSADHCRNEQIPSLRPAASPTATPELSMWANPAPSSRQNPDKPAPKDSADTHDQGPAIQNH